jgi:transposase
MPKKYEIGRIKAALAVFNAARTAEIEKPPKTLRPTEWASIAAGGASRDIIYKWQKKDWSQEELVDRIEKREGRRVLSEDQEKLLLGFATSMRASLEPVTLSQLSDFCASYFNKKISKSTFSRCLKGNSFSYQRVMPRNSRMISEEVVDEAIEVIEEIRSYNYPPSRIISMDETGLWSNVTAPKTYHFKNWCVFHSSS